MAPLDSIYVNAGSIFDYGVYGQAPKRLPPAKEYWLVYRYDQQGVPGTKAIPALIKAALRERGSFQAAKMHVTGVQLDIDAPTNSLATYAALVRALRKDLPPDMQISITGLLDWFRSGTAISSLIKEVDEFVPQFYDVQGPHRNGSYAIAAPIDAARWGPVFNRFGKRFRIGVSTFGRARMGDSELTDVRPIQLASDPAFSMQTSRTEAGEIILNYIAMRSTYLGYRAVPAGERVQFVLSTAGSIRAAVEAVRRMKGYCSGVVFFRWTAFNESMAAAPREVLAAAGLAHSQVPERAIIRAVDGGCVAVHCTDLYYSNAGPLLPDATRYRIHSSLDLQYFLPSEKLPVRMSGPSQLELRLPPYCSRGRMYLGRAVTADRAVFTLE